MSKSLKAALPSNAALTLLATALSPSNVPAVVPAGGKLVSSSSLLQPAAVAMARATMVASSNGNGGAFRRNRLFMEWLPRD